MSWKGKGEHSSRSVISQKWSLFLCLGSFCVGMLFTNRYGYVVFYYAFLEFSVPATFSKIIVQLCFSFSPEVGSTSIPFYWFVTVKNN